MNGSIRRNLWPATAVVACFACACLTGLLMAGDPSFVGPAYADYQDTPQASSSFVSSPRGQVGSATVPAAVKEWISMLLKSDPGQADASSRQASGPAEANARQPAAPSGEALSSPANSPSSSELTPELVALDDKVRQALATYYPRHQNTRDNSPWEVMHAIIAFGVDTQLFKGGPGGERVNAVGWTCYNYPCAGQRMLFLNGDKVDAERGVGVQGHAGQFLAILAQSHVKADYPLLVGGKNFTLADLVEHEKETCLSGGELTFKLISLMHYLDSDATWTTRDGQEWSIQRLVREELKQPIRGAACGGTHRLMGFSYAVNKRIQRGKPVVGEFRRAQVYVQDYHRYTLSLQNPDGSFSTEWFTRRGDSPDIDRRLKTSGHILEWIAFSMSDDELRDPRMIKAVDYLSTLLLKHPQHTWEIGPLGHALHALAIYHGRVLKTTGPDWPQTLVEESLTNPVLEARHPGKVGE